MSWTAKLTLLEKPPHHVVARFWASVDFDNSEECWPWGKNKNYDGYGIFYFDRKHWMAHRFSFEIVNGPVPLNLTIDHECRNRLCVNPKHLRLATNKKNILIGKAPSAGYAVAEKCIRGHVFDVKNTYRWQKKNGEWMRQCRACHNRRSAADMRAKRAERKRQVPRSIKCGL